MNEVPPEVSAVDAFIERFKEQFPSEESCIKYLIEQLRKYGDVGCPKCSAPIPKNAETRNVICENEACNNRWSVTANTFFCRTRNFLAMFAALWAFMEGIVLPGTIIAKLGNASTSTGWFNKKKVDMMAAANMDETCWQIATALCTAVISRRSLETPAHKHPTEEQRLVDAELKSNEAGELMHNPSHEVVTLSPYELTIVAILEHGPVQFDEICARVSFPDSEVSAALTMMEINGLVKHLDGDRYERCRHIIGAGAQSNNSFQSGEDLYAIVEKDLDTIKKSFGGGVSRKYLGFYLAGVSWARKEISERAKLMYKFCSRMESITLTAVQAYVSPPLVLVGR
ncbi:MAG: hypothetical protein IAF58_13495 [Leptolyngbya sp.]|nr:hypothetical protein [Candidatus Melainabacteria bacterium]